MLDHTQARQLAQDFASAITDRASGRDELDRQDQVLFARAGGTLKATSYCVVGNEEQVVVVQHATARRPGKTLDAVPLQVWQMRQGVWHEAWN